MSSRSSEDGASSKLWWMIFIATLIAIGMTGEVLIHG